MKSVSLRYAVLACIALCTAVVVCSLWHERPVMRPAENPAGEATEAAVRDEPEAAPIISMPRQLPTLAAAPLNQGVSAPAAAAAPESNDEPIKEVVAADRRAAMADQWGLTEEQTKALDTASEAPAEERMEVMLRYAQGKIAKKDLSAEIQAADERGLKRVHEVLGDERFNEYLSIRGRLEGDEPDMSPVPYSNL